MTWREGRLGLEPIKKHKFFEGVDWNILREIDAPWVPTLKSVTDTSYFPTEELESSSKQPIAMDANSASDLAFLG